MGWMPPTRLCRNSTVRFDVFSRFVVHVAGILVFKEPFARNAQFVYARNDIIVHIIEVDALNLGVFAVAKFIVGRLVARAGRRTARPGRSCYAGLAFRGNQGAGAWNHHLGTLLGCEKRGFLWSKGLWLPAGEREFWGESRVSLTLSPWLLRCLSPLGTAGWRGRLRGEYEGCRGTEQPRPHWGWVMLARL